MDWHGNEALKQFLVEMVSLVPDPRNARRHSDHNLKVIARSLEKYGQQTPVVHKDGTVVKGSGTLIAARGLGWMAIAAIPTALDGKELLAYKLTDNRSSDLSDFDWDIVREDFASLGADEDVSVIEDIGFTKSDMAGLGMPGEPGTGAADMTGLGTESLPNKCPRCGFEFQKTVAK